MSTIFNGNVIESRLSQNAKGGTEMMRDRFLRVVDKKFYSNCAIHFSRPQKYHKNLNIFYAHDLPDKDFMRQPRFDAYVFVSNWQRDLFINQNHYVTQENSYVIENAIEHQYPNWHRSNDVCRLVYHTTPHRGLEKLLPAYLKLREKYGDKIHLDVFSSFEIYGWSDENYQGLLDRVKSSEGITYHGYKPNKDVLKFLSQTASVFAYPSTWLETSCIAMIEAMACGVFVVHPTFGALTETGMNLSMSKPYENSFGFYDAMDKFISNFLLNEGKWTEIAIRNFKLPAKHSLHSYRDKWERVLRKENE